MSIHGLNSGVKTALSEVYGLNSGTKAALKEVYGLNSGTKDLIYQASKPVSNYAAAYIGTDKYLYVRPSGTTESDSNYIKTSLVCPVTGAIKFGFIDYCIYIISNLTVYYVTDVDATSWNSVAASTTYYTTGSTSSTNYGVQKIFQTSSYFISCQYTSMGHKIYYASTFEDLIKSPKSQANFVENGNGSNAFHRSEFYYNPSSHIYGEYLRSGCYVFFNSSFCNGDYCINYMPNTTPYYDNDGKKAYTLLSNGTMLIPYHFGVSDGIESGDRYYDTNGYEAYDNNYYITFSIVNSSGTIAKNFKLLYTTSHWEDCSYEDEDGNSYSASRETGSNFPDYFDNLDIEMSISGSYVYIKMCYQGYTEVYNDSDEESSHTTEGSYVTKYYKYDGSTITEVSSATIGDPYYCKSVDGKFYQYESINTGTVASSIIRAVHVA